MGEPSSPELARPPSPAESDATEVPDYPHGPRTIATDIEHIKSLIARSAAASQSPEASITAQVFRNRRGSTGSHGPVSQQRLFHELDLLKKRVKHEQHHVRRPSQIDPETESESEDAPDEREEELENIKEQLLEERKQSENLLSSAEVRIDNLTDEKEDMAELLKANQKELESLQQLKAELNTALAKSDEKIKVLEESNKSAGDDVRRLIAEHKTREEEFQRLYAELQEKHDNLEKDAKTSHVKAEKLKAAAVELESLKSQFEDLTKERDEHHAGNEARRKELEKSLQGLKAEHGDHLTRSTSDLEEMTRRLNIEQQENESLREQLKTNQDLHLEQVSSAEARIAQMEEAIKDFEQRTANAETTLKLREEALSNEVAVKEDEIAEIQRELSELHRKLYDLSIELHEKNAELSKATEDAEQSTIIASLQADLVKAQEACEATNQRWADDIARLKTEHSELTQKLQEGSSSQAKQVAKGHDAELSSARDEFQKEIAELSASSERRIDDVIESHANELAKMMDELQAEKSALRKSHKRELSRAHNEAEEHLASALANADDDLEERLCAQAKAHRKELDQLHESLNIELTQLHVQLEEAAQLRQTQMEEVQTVHTKTLSDLGTKLEAAHQSSALLQARLDAELTGRAEVERSLANFRRHKIEDDRTTIEAKEALLNQISELQKERDGFRKQVEGSQSSPKIGSSANTGGSAASNTDSVALEERVAAAEQARDEAQAIAEQKLEEMARQNEFLVKELETSMAQRNIEAAMAQRDAARSSADQQDASVQTESLPGGHAINNAAPLPEPKSDLATLQTSTLQRQDSKWEPERLPDAEAKRKSFEDYLKAAQAELADMRVDLSANEELFEEKVQEHMAELNAAREDLTATYQRKFGTLFAEKARMEKAVSAKIAAEFTAARNELLTSFGIDNKESSQREASNTGLPPRKQHAFQSAEESLVADYNRRITKRKSQIAAKHAEKFHALTQQLNDRMAELTSGKKKPRSRAASSKIELDDLDVSEAKASYVHKSSPSTANRLDLENALKAAFETTPKSKLPQRISISKPRTQTSIPRAMPYRCDWTSGDSTPQSAKAGNLSGFERTGTNDSNGERQPTDSEGSGTLTPGIVDAFRRLSIDPNDYEVEERRRLLQAQSPATSKSSRPRPTRMRHSSRAIFGFPQTSEA